MTTTTFKSVGGTTKTADEPAKGKQKAAPKPQKAAKATAPAKPGTIIIKGEGTIPVYADGAMRRLPKGKPVAVSAAELAFLKRSKVELA
ncbi:hypothetical protein [Mesorhizobium sp. B2-1-2]|uniref:hypothetical protein n=1 Tax=Mesorhizobium sp. B2-1-2 TaxID=2589973 RepID=UPI001747931F|nr:hypothetical protein [Mesorhizobium sp. B2-1-2]